MEPDCHAKGGLRATLSRWDHDPDDNRVAILLHTFIVGRCNICFFVADAEQVILSTTAATDERQPILVGLAYEMQRIKKINAKPHDVKLDAVVSESGILS